MSGLAVGSCEGNTDALLEPLGSGGGRSGKSGLSPNGLWAAAYMSYWQRVGMCISFEKWVKQTNGIQNDVLWCTVRADDQYPIEGAIYKE